MNGAASASVGRPNRGRKRLLNPLELLLQAVVSFLMYVLGTSTVHLEEQKVLSATQAASLSQESSRKKGKH